MEIGAPPHSTGIVEVTTIFIHKYALSDGIRRANVAEIKEGSYEDRKYRYVDMGRCVYLYEGKDWSLSEQEAVAVAEKARLKKIESLKKQIAKMEKMTFPIKDREE